MNQSFLEFVATIIGFLALYIAIKQQGNEIKRDIKQDMQSMENRLENDIKEVKDEVKITNVRIDNLESKLTARMDKLESDLAKLDSDLTARIDKLYDILTFTRQPLRRMHHK